MSYQPRNNVRMQVRYPSNYRANFLWPVESGSIEEAGYEFANGKTEAYRKSWWKILKARIKASVCTSIPHP